MVVLAIIVTQPTINSTTVVVILRIIHVFLFVLVFFIIVRMQGPLPPILRRSIVTRNEAKYCMFVTRKIATRNQKKQNKPKHKIAVFIHFVLLYLFLRFFFFLLFFFYCASYVHQTKRNLKLSPKTCVPL